MTRDPILSAFDHQVRRHPERPLVLARSRAATVGQVAAMAEGLGRTLATLDVPQGALLGFAAPNGPAFLAGLVALRRAGLGVALLDPASPASEQRRVAEHLGAFGLLSTRVGWPGVATAPGSYRHDEWRLETWPPPSRAERVLGAPIVKVTSGSTGAPRGVRASAENVCADEAALFSTMGLHGRDVILGAIPMSHSYGFSSVALPALVRGCAVAVPEEPGPLAPLESARAAEVTVMPTVPAYLQGLVALHRPEVWPRSVRLVVSAGARLTPATAAGFFELFGQRVHCFYGASECGGITYDREGGAAERGTVGSPVDGVTIDLEGLTSGADQDGVVVVASAAVAEGYLNEPSPRLDRGRFRTSDRGSWADGELRLGGRLDGIINVKGRKVDPGEVERVIAELDGVIDAIVLGVPGRHDGTEAVGAVVACRPGTLTAQDVMTFCREHLAEHKVPRRVRLVAELPRTSRGKVDRGALLGPESAGFST